MKSFKQFLAITGLLLGIIACKDTSSDIIPSDSTTQTIPATNLDKLDPIQLEKVSKLVADVMQDHTVLAEVKNVIDRKIELHDDEFTSLLPYMGEDKNHSSFTTPLLYDKMKDLLTKTSDEQTKLFAILNPLEIYWIYSKVWDGKTTPTVCYATEDAELEQIVTNMTGFVKHGDSYEQVIIDEGYMVEHSVMVIRRLQPTRTAEQNLQKELLRNTKVESTSATKAKAAILYLTGYDMSNWTNDNENSGNTNNLFFTGSQSNPNFTMYQQPYKRLVLRRTFFYTSPSSSGPITLVRGSIFASSEYNSTHRYSYTYRIRLYLSLSTEQKTGYSSVTFKTTDLRLEYNDAWWNNKANQINNFYKKPIILITNLLLGSSQKVTIVDTPAESMGSAWAFYETGKVFFDGFIRTYGYNGKKFRYTTTPCNGDGGVGVVSTSSQNLVNNFGTLLELQTLEAGSSHYFKWEYPSDRDAYGSAHSSFDIPLNITCNPTFYAFINYVDKKGTLGTLINSSFSYDSVSKWPNGKVRSGNFLLEVKL